MCVRLPLEDFNPVPCKVTITPRICGGKKKLFNILIKTKSVNLFGKIK